MFAALTLSSPLSRAFVVVVMLVTTTACDRTVPGTELQPAEVVVVLPVVNGSALHMALMADPGIKAARSQYLSRAASVDVARSLTRSRLTAQISAGAEAADGAAGTASLTYSRLLRDGGKSERQLALALLQQDQARLDISLATEKVSEKIISAYIDQHVARRKIAVINRYVSQYNARADLVNSAVASGVMSSSDLLEIQSVKNDIDTVLADAKFTKRLAEVELLELLGPQYSTALAELNVLATNFTSRKLGDAPKYRLESLGLQRRVTELQSQIALRKNRPVTSMQGRINSPLDESEDATVFAGINIAFSFLDGGAAKAEARALDHSTEAAVQQHQVLETRIRAAARSLAAFDQFNVESQSLLQRREDISRERVIAMEGLLRAGRADIASIAKEILEGARARLALTDLEGQALRQRGRAFAVQGGLCQLLEACNIFAGERHAG